MPIKASDISMEQIKIYFHEASSEFCAGIIYKISAGQRCGFNENPCQRQVRAHDKCIEPANITTAAEYLRMALFGFAFFRRITEVVKHSRENTQDIMHKNSFPNPSISMYGLNMPGRFAVNAPYTKPAE